MPGATALLAASNSLGYATDEECLIALGCGDCQILDLLEQLLPQDANKAVSSVANSEMTQMSLIAEEAGPASVSESFHVQMLADDRSGLLMDITTFLGAQGIMLLSNSGRVMPSSGDALITIEVRLENLLELHKLLDELEMIPAVRAAKLIDREQINDLRQK
jgi:(p)ppGpp synthase/HD superfamily hydrolase